MTTQAQRARPLGPRLLAKINLPGVTFLIVLFAVWEAADRAGLIDLMFLPRPSEILSAGATLIAQNAFLPTVGHTVSVTLTGWAIASCSGLMIGFALGMSRRVWVYSMSTIELFRALPSVVLLPIAVLVFGFSVQMELVLVIVSAQWPVMVSAVDGVRLVPQGLRDTATTLRLGRLETARKIILPAALPKVLVGLRLSLALSLILTVAAEMPRRCSVTRRAWATRWSRPRKRCRPTRCSSTSSPSGCSACCSTPPSSSSPG